MSEGPARPSEQELDDLARRAEEALAEIRAALVEGRTAPDSPKFTGSFAETVIEEER